MSLLRRTGTGRNNIDWFNASSNSSGNYLRRTGTSRNNISWLNINSNGTHNLLNRTSTGRNNIQWKNTTFSFGGDLTKISSLISYLVDNTYGDPWLIFASGYNNSTKDILGYSPNAVSYTKNTISWVSMDGGVLGSYNSSFTVYYFGLCTKSQDNANTIADELLKFNKLQCGNAIVNIIKNKRIWQYLKYYDPYSKLGYVALVQISSNISLRNGNSIIFS